MKKGFTFIELVLTIGIFSILAALTSINFLSTYSRANLGSVEDILIADLKTAQANAMAGAGDTTWDPSSLTLPTPITLTSGFPGGQITFLHGSGEIAGFTAGEDTLTLSSGSDSKILKLNKYGTLIGD